MRTILLIVFFGFALQAAAQSPSNEKEIRERNFRAEHKIKSRTEYMLTGQGEHEKKKLYRQELYDEKGFLLREVAVMPGGGDSATTVYTYDAKGNLTDITNSTQMGGFDNMSIKYDAKGNRIGGTYAADDDQGKMNYIYDQDGNLVQIESIQEAVDPPDEASKVTVDSFYYDKAGNTIREVEYYGGEEISRTKHAYDANGHEIKTERLRDGKVYATETYEYDENGLAIKHNISDLEVGPSRYVYEYEYYP